MKAGASILLVSLALVLDQSSKFWVEANLPLREPVELIPYLSMFRTYNTGIAFSFLSFMDDQWLVLLTLAILGFVAVLWWRTPADRFWARLGFALVFGGALGNLIDRVMLGHVVDFILVHTQNWSFAVFNFADSFITVGAILIVVDEFTGTRRHPDAGGGT